MIIILFLEYHFEGVRKNEMELANMVADNHLGDDFSSSDKRIMVVLAKKV